jgi:prefoldin subunit 5
VVSNRVFIVGIVCIILIAGLCGATAYYLNEGIQNLKTLCTNLQTEIGNLNTTLQNRIGNLQNQIANLNTTLQNRIGNLTGGLRVLQNQMGNLTAEMGNLTAEMGNLQNQIGNLNTTLHIQIAILQNQIANLNTTFSEPLTSASYIIFTNGTEYFARNCTSEKIYCQGTNASQVVNSAMKAVPLSRPVVIDFAPGDYNLTASIVLRNYTIINGAGEYATTFTTPNNITVIKVNGSTNTGRIDNIVLENFGIVGNGDRSHNGTTGLQLWFLNEPIVQNVRILFCYIGINTVELWKPMMSTLWIEWCNKGYLTDYFPNSTTAEVRLNDFEIQYCDIGLYLYRRATAVMLSQGEIGGCNTAIQVEELSFAHISNVLLDSDNQAGIKIIQNGNCVIKGIQWSNVWVGATNSSSLQGAVTIIAENRSDVYDLSFENIQVRTFYPSGFFMENVSNVQISGGEIYGDFPNAEYGIYLNGCSNVTISGLRVYGLTAGVSWGIYEEGSSNYDTIYGCTCTAGAGGIRTVGVQTHVDLCWNNTSWIP